MIAAHIAALSASAWTALYFLATLILPLLPVIGRHYAKWDKDKRYQACGLLPSTTFILVIVPLSLWVLFFDDEIHAVRVTGSTFMSMTTISIAFGYFMYDSVVIFTHLRLEGYALLAHGVLCMITYGAAVAFEVYQYYGPVFLMFESSTLFVNFRW